MTAAAREKTRAHEQVFVARLQGRLIPGPCERKDATCLGVIHGHHRNGYGPDHRLDVVWLCASHHGREHAELRRPTKASPDDASRSVSDWLEPELLGVVGL